MTGLMMAWKWGASPAQEPLQQASWGCRYRFAELGTSSTAPKELGASKFRVHNDSRRGGGAGQGCVHGAHKALIEAPLEGLEQPEAAAWSVPP